MKRLFIINLFALLVATLGGIVIFTLIPEPILDSIFRGIGAFCTGYGIVYISRKILNQL